MKAVIKRLEVPTKGLTRRNRDRLRPFDDPANVQLLIDLPQRLIKEVGSGKLSPHRAALRAQTAVALEVLLMAPIRLRNLMSLEFGQIPLPSVAKRSNSGSSRVSKSE
jgi:hypothetical protein